MKKITLFSILAVMFAALAFTSCNSDSDNSTSLPTQEEAQAMLNTVAGYHPCGILFPGNNATNESDKIAKDSVEAVLRITAKDSSFVISDFPVKNLAKYIKDESLSKLVAALPNQNLNGKLLAYPGGTATSPVFGSVTQNIEFKDAEGKSVKFLFYAGYTNYSLAGYASQTTGTTTKKIFLMYLTPGAIYVSDQMKSDALKTQSSSYGSVPYVISLKYNL